MVRAPGCVAIVSMQQLLVLCVQHGDGSCMFLVLVRKDVFLNDMQSVPLELGIAQGVGIMSKCTSFHSKLSLDKS